MYQSKNNIKKFIMDKPDVFPGIQSVQFIALNIKTYQITVNKSETINILYWKICK